MIPNHSEEMSMLFYNPCFSLNQLMTSYCYYETNKNERSNKKQAGSEEIGKTTEKIIQQYCLCREDNLNIIQSMEFSRIPVLVSDLFQPISNGNEGSIVDDNFQCENSNKTCCNRLTPRPQFDLKSEGNDSVMKKRDDKQQEINLSADSTQSQPINIEAKCESDGQIQVKDKIQGARLTSKTSQIFSQESRLSTRLDVVLKSIFRAMKMYYKKEFYSFLRSQKLKCKAGLGDKVFKSAETYITKNINLTNVRQCSWFLVALSDSKNKCKHLDPHYNQIFQSVKSLLNRFNRSKMDELLSNSSFSKLFEHFFENGSSALLSRKDYTTREVYEEQFEIILKREVPLKDPRKLCTSDIVYAQDH